MSYQSTNNRILYVSSSKNITTQTSVWTSRLTSNSQVYYDNNGVATDSSPSINANEDTYTYAKPTNSEIKSDIAGLTGVSSTNCSANDSQTDAQTATSSYINSHETTIGSTNIKISDLYQHLTGITPTAGSNISFGSNTFRYIKKRDGNYDVDLEHELTGYKFSNFRNQKIIRSTYDDDIKEAKTYWYSNWGNGRYTKWTTYEGWQLPSVDWTILNWAYGFIWLGRSEWTLYAMYNKI